MNLVLSVGLGVDLDIPVGIQGTQSQVPHAKGRSYSSSVSEWGRVGPCRNGLAGPARFHHPWLAKRNQKSITLQY